MMTPGCCVWTRGDDIAACNGASLYERMREDILTGALRPGQLISERALVDQYGASGNTRLRRLIGSLLDDMDRVISATVALSYRVGDMQQDHRTIVDALAGRDPQEAERVVQEAMEASRRRIAEALRLVES